VRWVVFHNMPVSDNPRVDGSFSDIGLYLLAAVVGGAVLGWLIKNALTGSRINDLNDTWRAQQDDIVRQRDRLTSEAVKLRTSIEAQEAVIHQRDMAASKVQTELNSALEREKLMTKNLFTLRAEREDFKAKVASFQKRLLSVQRQSTELQTQFIKSGDFYKNELTKAFERRRALEEKVDNSNAEHESFSNLLQASRTEHHSVNKMLAAAKARLENLDLLENNVIELEAENAQLKHNAAKTRQKIDAMKRDVAEQEELKLQNKELAQVIKSMENSRKQYENDANRYREHAGKTEKKSETLRIRLDEVEQNFLEMEKQQDQALKDARQSTSQSMNGTKPAKVENDDLQEIIGIGKVFEHTLHELGIVSYRQIAYFGVADIARVNAELKEFKGRMEQDDWIGQAKDLLYKKYG
jgi:predicted flap endonuclease-1-like 5' DNA nuclease